MGFPNRSASLTTLIAVAAALGTMPAISNREVKDKTCSKCLKPFSNRGAYCPECHKAQKESDK